MKDDGGPRRAHSAGVHGSPLEIVDGLVKIVTFRDVAIGTHLDAVGILSGRLARALGYDAEFAERVTLAGRLHDVGKNMVPLEILLKPGPLSSDEWIEMKRHPEYSASMVRCFEPLASLIEIVRLHHERIDGQGYPDRRIGSEIPIEARIVAVADAFHAMTVTRPYMAARSPGYAIGELISGSGTQFDAACVEAFITMMGASQDAGTLDQRSTA